MAILHPMLPAVEELPGIRRIHSAYLPYFCPIRK